MSATYLTDVNANNFCISDYLFEKQVIFLKQTTKENVLLELVELLDQENILKDKHHFYNLILAREEIVSTGIGMGIAVPHAKIADYDRFFVAVGIHSKGIVWDAIDGVLVRLVFMIGGPENQQITYLQLLSKLTSALKDDDRRKLLLGVQSKKDVIKLFTGI